MEESKHSSALSYKLLSHPMRVSILRRMAEEGCLSPVQYSREVDANLNNASYHFRELEKAGAIKLVKTGARRGAAVHFYRLQPKSSVVRFLFGDEIATQAKAERLLEASTWQRSHRGNSLSALAPVRLDDRGKREVEETVEAMIGRLIEIDVEARRRLDKANIEAPLLHVGVVTLLPVDEGKFVK